MYIKTHNKEIGAKLAAHYQAKKPVEIMGKLFLGNSIGFEYPDSCVEFYGSEVSKVAWTGEGLPPVGTVCDRRFPEVEGSSWRQVTILFLGDQKVFYRDEAGDEWANLPDDVQFRPTRTPEQIAAEARKRITDDIQQVCVDGENNGVPFHEALYLAGYRKQENS